MCLILVVCGGMMHIGVLDLRSGVLEVESGCLLGYAMLTYVEWLEGERWRC